ncbi:magnetic particle specific iron-binding protein [Magnetospirillum sp. ME-1]|nr:magnetic particle specific iron-binding protein [Magnetospirillum sp. ME-1]
MAAKTGVATAVAAPAAPANVAAAQGAGTKVALGAGKAAAGAKVVGGTIWTGKGLGLGLGLGLGAWGPIILGVVGAGAVYAYMKSRDIESAQSDEEVELRDALA